MNDLKITATLHTAAGVPYSGTLFRGPGPRCDIGFTPKPAEAAYWFGKITPAVPAFCRIFSPPGAGLPRWDSPTITGLPAGCLPWISHKDPVNPDAVATYWAGMPAPDGRRYRWTYFHECAPNTDQQYKQYIDYFSALVRRAVSFPHIELVQIQSLYAMRWRPDTEWRRWLLPGVSLGFDSYPLQGDTVRYEPPESMFALLEYAAGVIGAPSWGVPEIGAQIRPGQDRAHWLLDATDYLRAAGASFVGLWCSQDEHGDFRPDDDPTLTAYREILT